MRVAGLLAWGLLAWGLLAWGYSALESRVGAPLWRTLGTPRLELATRAAHISAVLRHQRGVTPHRSQRLVHGLACRGDLLGREQRLA